VGDDGVLLVDSGAGPVSDKVLAAIRQLSSKPIRIVINTVADSDHTGGNEVLAKSGSRIGGGVLVGGRAEDGAMVIAHEQVLAAMSAPTGRVSPTPARAWPTDTYTGDSKDVYANGEGIQILHQPAAHTEGDSLVYFRRSDVIVTGDIFTTTGYPVIDAEKPGSFSGVLDGLNRLIDIAIPKDWQEGGTMVIPGHGRIAEESDVVEYRDMITIIGDRIQDMIKKGMTLAQVKAARPTRDYDGRYGTATGPWTTDMFIEAAYRNLSRRGTQ
jgi:glyoxylase-like metal-dependent hydrolase (beta-lactamase superfamily II)